VTSMPKSKALNECVIAESLVEADGARNVHWPVVVI